MTVRAQRYSVGDAVRTFLGEWLYVVNFQKRQTKFLKRSGLATTFAMAFGVISNPGSDFWITNIYRA